jgi:heptosyltransferase-1
VKLLIVKTSSMGDVIHALPTVSDLRMQRPDVQVHWLVEAPFAPLVALHPGVSRVLPLRWRQWRRQLGERATWQAMGALRTELVLARYDLVLDLQGLAKSALWARMAAAPVAGYDMASAREPLAAWAYARRAAVPLDLHAVERCRRLAAAHLGYTLPTARARFGLHAAGRPDLEGLRYAALMPGASKPEKLWPLAHWQAVARHLAALGVQPWVFWGSEAERVQAQQITDAAGGMLPPLLPLDQVAATLAGAQVVVGLDTGLSHLAAALGRPTLGIYCNHEPQLTGVVGDGRVVSLGGKRRPPSLAEVTQALDGMLATAHEEALP